MNRLKLFGERIKCRDPDRQTTKIQIRIPRGGAPTDGACHSVLNRFRALG
jgi:hypothetical protein